MKPKRTKKPAVPKKTRVQSKRGSRNKGKSYERDSAESLSAIWPKAKRGIGQVRAAGEVPDVTGTPFWVEAKHKFKAPNVFAAMEQAHIAWSSSKDNVYAYGHGPLVVAKKTGYHIEIVAMPKHKFIELMQAMKYMFNELVSVSIDDPTRELSDQLQKLRGWF